MTSHEKRINALMRFHGLTKSEAEKRAKEIEKTKPAKNPAKRSRGKNPVISRPSQVTGKKPTARLKNRRVKNLKMPRGVFPNPSIKEKSNPSSVHFDIDVNSHNARGAKAKTRTNPVKRGVTCRPSKASRKAVYAVESSRSAKGPWESQGIFPGEDKARNYAEALAVSHPSYYFRVVIK